MVLFWPNKTKDSAFKVENFEEIRPNRNKVVPAFKNDLFKNSKFIAPKLFLT